MECIYEARHGFEAQLLKDVLAQEGIDAEVCGDYLQGAVGDLPALGLVQLRVAPEQAAAARAVLLRWQAGEMALPDDESPSRTVEPPRRKRPQPLDPAWLLMGLLPLLMAAAALALAQ
jgi:hypothetical protein